MHNFNDCIDQTDYEKTLRCLKNEIEPPGIILQEKQGFGFYSECTIFFYKEKGELYYVAYEDMDYKCKHGRINNQRMQRIMGTDYYSSDESNILIDVLE